MGRRKFRLGRLPKNYDRPKGTFKKALGRPRKLKASVPSNLPSSAVQSARSPSVASSVFDDQDQDVVMSSTPDCSFDASAAVHSDLLCKSPGDRSRMSSPDFSCPSSLFSDRSSSGVTENASSSMDASTEIEHESEDCASVEPCVPPEYGQEKDSSALIDVGSDHWMKLLTNGVHLPNERWVIQLLNSDLGICKLSCNMSQTFFVVYSIIVAPDHQWTWKAG